MSDLSIYENAPVGVNLGGWLSQYKEYDHKHFQSFISAADIRQIADWGMDHIRLPIDYQILENDAAPGEYIESGFDYIESCLDWCAENGLSVALDMHHAPGYSFTQTLEGEDGNTLFTSDIAQNRFFALWHAIARRFKGKYPGLAFELLNEIVLPESAPWNLLAKTAVAHLRQTDATRPIIVGSNNYSAVYTLKELELIDDPNIIYTFHSYEPLMFTHQRAPWVPATRTHNAVVDYPGEIAGLEAFATANPEHAWACTDLIGKSLDASFLQRFIQDALDFQQRCQRPVYCGEFGVIELAPPLSRQNWLRDFVSFLNEHKIGRAIWSYKQMDFGLVDANSKVIDPEYVRIASMR